MGKIILHCDMNNFFASVELLEHSELQAFPVAVAGEKEQRHGIVLAKNELAKKYGVKTAMPLWQAKQCCPDLVFLSPHHEKYRIFSQKAREIYLEYTNRIESFGLDEVWLDVTGSSFFMGDGVAIAEDIRNQVRNQLCLTVSIGVSFNKIFAKLGSDLKKPDAVSIIKEDNWQQVVWPLPVESLLYVGPSITRQLHQYGIFTIGQLAQLQPRYLKSWFGKFGDTLWRFANGIDYSSVAQDGNIVPPKSIGSSTTTSKDMETEEELTAVLAKLCQEVSARLKREGVLGSTLQVDMRWSNLTWSQHQVSLNFSTDSAYTLLDEAKKLCDFYRKGRPLRSIGVRVSRLSSETNVQLSLYEKEIRRQRKRELEKTVDLLNKKYGSHSLVPASALCSHFTSSVVIGKSVFP